MRIDGYTYSQAYINNTPDAISGKNNNTTDPYALDVKIGDAKDQGPKQRTTDSGCRQTDSGCYGTQDGCYGTQSGCYGTQNGC